MRCLIDGSIKGAIVFSKEDIAKLRSIAMNEWEKISAKSPRCRDMVEIMRRFMKDKGKI